MIRMHSVRRVHMVLFIGLMVFGSPAGTVSADMTSYCQIPPYVIQNVRPNVLLLLDTSKRMQNFAYNDGPNTSGVVNFCNDSANPCTKFNGAGRPTRYYGYFDPNQWYAYNSPGASNVFKAMAARTPTNPNGYWSGDFLNWLTMRRIDVMRYALTGGKPTGGSLAAWKPDDVSYGAYKRLSSAELSLNTPFSDDAGADFVFGTTGADASFTVYSAGTAVKLNSQSYNAKVLVNSVSGVLQDTVGSKARLGLMVTNDTYSGQIVTDVGKGPASDPNNSLSSTIAAINNIQPNVNATPLAQALWVATGSFAQVDLLEGGPGPLYSGPTLVNPGKDPMNYGTAGLRRYPACQKNFVLLLTDGVPNNDGNIPSSINSYGANSAFDCDTTCGATGETSGAEDVALWMHTHDLRSSSLGFNNIPRFQNITLYTVVAFGQDSELMKRAAINGGFEPAALGLTPPSGTPSNTYFFGGDDIAGKLKAAFESMLKTASSGTAASVLASGEGSGANLLQAAFYPVRSFGNDTISWAGSLQNMWYFVDPRFSNAAIFEDTTRDYTLNLTNDLIVNFKYDTDSQLTVAKRYHSDSNGVRGTEVTPPLAFEKINSLWEAGKILWSRTSPRTIYTNVGGVVRGSGTPPSPDMKPFSTTNVSATLLATSGDTTKIINYVKGIDDLNDLTLRPRTVSIDGVSNVWKLGDIVNSTPRVVASVPLNKYDTVYDDSSYGTFIQTDLYKDRGMVFTGGNDGMLHAFKLGKLELSGSWRDSYSKKAHLSGVNLGEEAWAFIPKNALPYLQYLQDPEYCHLYYTDLSPYVFDASIGTGTGDKSGNPLYQHPTDANDANNSWRTVVIGGMRTGGACSMTCTAGSNCVPTPGGGDLGYSSYFALDVTDPTSPQLMWEFSAPGLGFSTTGPAVVRIYGRETTTLSRQKYLNGEWYVVFGSGPTGKIDITNNQFYGYSNQPLKFFVLKLKTGELVQTITPNPTISEAFAGSMINSVADYNRDYQDDAIYVGYVKNSGSTPSNTWNKGGVGRILTGNTSPADAGGGSWKWVTLIDGIGPVTSAVARLQNTLTTPNTNWLYFGTGRYFFVNPPGTSSDPNADPNAPVIDDSGYGGISRPIVRNQLFGIKDTCLNTDSTTCTYSVAAPPTDGTDTDTFRNVTSLNRVPPDPNAIAGYKGWFLDMDPLTTGVFHSERVITDPLATVSGTVFFTSYKPYANECALGGQSFLWALRYDTGGAPSGLKGQALLQVSTASVEQIDLSRAFTAAGGADAGTGYRRAMGIEGVPPTAQGLSLLSQPPPVKRILHMMER